MNKTGGERVPAGSNSVAPTRRCSCGTAALSDPVLGWGQTRPAAAFTDTDFWTLRKFIRSSPVLKVSTLYFLTVAVLVYKLHSSTAARMPSRCAEVNYFKLLPPVI
jgi:hypothetical protein